MPIHIVAGIALVCFLIVLSVIMFMLKVWIPFSDEVSYLKMEIGRTTGRDRAHWERKLKTFYRERIPIIGHFM